MEKVVGKSMSICEQLGNTHCSMHSFQTAELLEPTYKNQIRLCIYDYKKKHIKNVDCRWMFYCTCDSNVIVW